MKKFLSVFLVLVMLLSLAACGGNEDDTQKENDVNVSENEKDNGHNKVIDDGKITVEKVRNAPETDASNFETHLFDGGVIIDKYIGQDTIVVIPEKINGVPVVSIGENSFLNNNTVKGVNVSDTVEDIGPLAFANCLSLEIFLSGKNVKKIGSYAFNYCKGLKVLELNEGLKSLQYGCFIETNQLNEVYISSSVTEIDTPFVQFDTEVTIVTESGSVAETYAKENGIKYEIR